MTTQLFKTRGRIFGHVHAVERGRYYLVDVSNANPGPMFIAGDQVGLSLAEIARLPEPKLEECGGHVRCYQYPGHGSEVIFQGVWCPYSGSIEKPGRMTLGDAPVAVAHRAFKGRLWCPAPQNYEEVQ